MMKIPRGEVPDVTMTLARWADQDFYQPQAGSALRKITKAMREDDPLTGDMYALVIDGLTPSEVDVINKAASQQVTEVPGATGLPWSQ